MKKIGITCYPTVGGSGVIATELGMLLAEQGHQIHFITSSIPFRLDRIYPQIYYHEVELNHYPVFQYPPYDLALATKMAEVIDEEKLDILHVHYAMPHAICAILARDIAERDVKIVTTLHGTDITVLGIDHTFKKMIKHGIEQSDAVTAVSNDLVEQTYEMLDVQKDISVIYNFVNEKEYVKKELPHLREQYGIKADERVIIHISNFRKVKRVEDVIYTFEKIQHHCKSKLLLVGDGPEYTSIVQLVKDLGINDKVLFLGKQKNISDLLSISDLKLLLSEKESFGLVLLEAMACEVPCIGTRAGGIPEVIEHGETGYLVNIGDTEQAAAYAIELLTNSERLVEFSNRSLTHAMEHFHSKKIVRQYLQLYNNLGNE
ncbi:N-acetyl-alpha-D-glucosaminyl L-malate synthase BshA [Virgibacillus halodenitrificans]|jgi:L-malate glycosyltransferase|uniref:N-acetyl-alpha-D-glucosaminyl L-malate synthase BshA n=1 Tax=Virgibacillus halodenitrificans TaxID=1482 RepID=A0AAC9J0N1_VIRHA|nr:N-acetyl-alpha-D-glucosaminyl L-malate synthase BshA [Virgibacillus halodenitrificans]APC48453.1 N-acetyl-alpha-D-glucosaminyl L-malate synthase BshA [Virgibacillus halodenitrificans]MBD1222591.1 N-acetyl-alpha-D-glucosaminyl L-malate synthase BshA [Virgibacillus halodenitrificans]MCG1028324.1 N-acetyl-alpha-D-glucosaminyl L-malate synthase BshA [Virgibacillus halodenitrificans]MCJ0931026.1 N-acetyl-alpha-D-glucosaminyl L-malate synthase BshA [Virgibacillus halodenitrificans]MEC2160413.1 N-